MLYRRSGPRSVSDWGLFSVLHQQAFRQSNLSLPSLAHGLRDRQTDRQTESWREIERDRETETETETDRQTDRDRELERERERESKKKQADVVMRANVFPASV